MTALQNKTLLAIGLILVTTTFGPLMDVIAKYLGQAGVPVPLIVWARFAFGALCNLPFALHVGGRSVLRASSLKPNALRALCLMLSTYFFFASLRYLPIADTLSIYFLQPLLVVIFSPFMLREKVGWKRGLTVLVGFSGVLIIIRPGFQTLNPGHLFAVLSGLCSALNIMITRLSRGQSDPVIASFQTTLIAALGMTVLLPASWQAPLPGQWLLFATLGMIAAASLYLITKAYEYGEASLLSPLNYTEMVPAAVCGWLFFGDIPDRYTLLGVAILIGCALYISQSEHRKIGADEASEAAHP